jgi:hypothetical protein
VQNTPNVCNVCDVSNGFRVMSYRYYQRMWWSVPLLLAKRSPRFEVPLRATSWHIYFIIFHLPTFKSKNLYCYVVPNYVFYVLCVKKFWFIVIEGINHSFSLEVELLYLQYHMCYRTSSSADFSAYLYPFRDLIAPARDVGCMTWGHAKSPHSSCSFYA